MTDKKRRLVPFGEAGSDKQEQEQQEKRPKPDRGPCVDLLAQLDCAVCLNKPIFPPIRQCPNGHLLCNSCSQKPQCQNCPQCRAYPTSIRNLALEKAAEGLILACPYEAKGCNKTNSYLEAERHARHCDFKPFKCPVHGTQGTCKERLDMKPELILQHIVEKHGVQIISEGSEATEGVILEYDSTNGRIEGGWQDRLVRADGMTFLVRVVEEGEHYGVRVQGLDVDTESCRFSCIITIERRRRRLVWEGPVRGVGNNSQRWAKKQNTMCIPMAWGKKVGQKGCALVLHLAMKKIKGHAVERDSEEPAEVAADEESEHNPPSTFLGAGNATSVASEVTSS